MSLTTPPKIDWGPEAVADTDMNEIGVNLNALESSKNQDGDSPTYIDVTATSIDSGGGAFKQKVVSLVIASGAGPHNIAHGLTVGNIRGLQFAHDSSAAYVDQFRLNGANIQVIFNASVATTLYCVITYV